MSGAAHAVNGTRDEGPQWEQAQTAFGRNADAGNERTYHGTGHGFEDAD